MTYILQKTEIKNAPRQLIEFVRRLGMEKHAKMQDLRDETEFTYSVNL